MGVVVRAVPGRVRRLRVGRHRARQGGRVPRASTAPTRTRRRKRFLAKRWLPFPSYTDPDEDIAQAIEAPKNYPITVFVDSNGKTAYIHSGPYKSDKQLNDDIDKYFKL